MKVTEEEIRPAKIFNEYLTLTNQDIITYFSDSRRVEIVCPVCDKQGKLWTEKGGFSYQICDSCLSIYVSPRPEKSAFDAYYTDSPSTKFWATTFYKCTEAARREKLWKPKAQLLKNIIEKLKKDSPIDYIVDIGGGYGVFDEEIQLIMDIKPIIIEPSVHLADICREKGLTVIEKFMEDVLPEDFPEGGKCYVSFELFEHVHDPRSFLESIFSAMEHNDLFVFTTLSGIGLDIQVLKNQAKSLSPPHHLNFLNPKSVSLLLEQVGFEVIDALTPGKLDIDILTNNKEHIKDDFWKHILGYASSDQLQNLQNAIAENGLSSHMMLTCKKP